MGELEVEHPLVVARRLLADAESGVIADEVADRDGEVAERIQVVWGRLGLLDRLAVTGSQELSVVARAGADPIRVEGVVCEVGNSWFRMTPRTGQVLINAAAVISVSGLGDAARDPKSVSAIDRARGWTQVLRQFTNQRIFVIAEDGSVNKGTVRRVGSDHVDLADEGDTRTTVIFDAISIVKVFAAERM